MQRITRCLGLVLFIAALSGPVSLQAQNIQHGRQFAREDRDRDRDDRYDRRYYDRRYKMYHVWNAREESAYRRWIEERHEGYRDFATIRRQQQDTYWQWRHEHPDYGRRH